MSFDRSPVHFHNTPRRRRPMRWLAPISLAILATLWGILLAPSINAQQNSADSQSGRSASQISESVPRNSSPFYDSDKDYRIRPGDTIQIHIEDAPELSHNYQVNASGLIEMKVLGQVDAQRKTIYELAKTIERGLREGEYLTDPNVTITVNQRSGKTFYIQGMVHHPGAIQVEGQDEHLPLLKLINLAGGLAEGYGANATIKRRIRTKLPSSVADSQIASLQDQTANSDQPSKTQAGEKPKPQASECDCEIIKVNISALLQGQSDQQVEPEDYVNIPPADLFYVSGEIRNARAYTLKDGTTLSQAISLAGGMTFSAKADESVIFRENPLDGSRKPIKVDINAIMKGKQADIPLQANDVIVIPNSRAKSVGETILRALGGSARLPLPYPY